MRRALSSIVVGLAMLPAGPSEAVPPCQRAETVADMRPAGGGRVSVTGLGIVDTGLLDVSIPFGTRTLIAGLDLRFSFPARLGGARTSIDHVASMDVLDAVIEGAQEVRVFGAVGMLEVTPVHLRCVADDGGRVDERTDEITFSPLTDAPNAALVLVQPPV